MRVNPDELLRRTSQHFSASSPTKPPSSTKHKKLPKNYENFDYNPFVNTPVKPRSYTTFTSSPIPKPSPTPKKTTARSAFHLSPSPLRNAGNRYLNHASPTCSVKKQKRSSSKKEVAVVAEDSPNVRNSKFSRGASKPKTVKAYPCSNLSTI